MSDARPYSLIPDVPCGACRCPRDRRFYVALSRDLNVRAFEGSVDRLVPYVFKVGTMKVCHDRIRSLNEFRKKTDGDQGRVYAEPAYAGATDWKILLCRQVETDRYDDAVFKGWLKNAYDPSDVRSVGYCSIPDVEGVDPRRRFRDLCIMSEDFVRRRTAVRANHPLNDEMLGAVAQVLALVGDEFLRRAT